MIQLVDIALGKIMKLTGKFEFDLEDLDIVILGGLKNQLRN